MQHIIKKENLSFSNFLSNILIKFNEHVIQYFVLLGDL
jgi:hypothetical protein